MFEEEFQKKAQLQKESEERIEALKKAQKIKKYHAGSKLNEVSFVF